MCKLRHCLWWILTAVNILRVCSFLQALATLEVYDYVYRVNYKLLIVCIALDCITDSRLNGRIV